MINPSPLSDDEVTLWIDQLRTKDPSAAQSLWNCYATGLAKMARRKFGQLSRKAYDEEDAAISAFRSFCLGVQQDRFLDLNDRDDIWRLLVTITARKVNARRRYEFRERRGGEQIRERSFNELESDDGRNFADLIESSEPSPQFAAELLEECQLLLNNLNDESLQQIALLKIEGYNNSEIADLLGCSRHRVQRKLARIRNQLQHTSQVEDE